MFFGLGAYSFGLIMQKLSVPIPVAFVATLAITAVIAAIIGAICVRLKEIYFAFVTLAFQMLIHSTILSWAVLHRRRPGPARRHSATRVSSASICPTTSIFMLRAARC
jgi:ABC-type branched-subunit amino acid transport system permease subunit